MLLYAADLPAAGRRAAARRVARANMAQKCHWREVFERVLLLLVAGVTRGGRGGAAGARGAPWTR
jgi:hypothetical protein